MVTAEIIASLPYTDHRQRRHRHRHLLKIQARFCCCRHDFCSWTLKLSRAEEPEKVWRKSHSDKRQLKPDAEATDAKQYFALSSRIRISHDVQSNKIELWKRHFLSHLLNRQTHLQSRACMHSKEELHGFSRSSAESAVQASPSLKLFSVFYSRREFTSQKMSGFGILGRWNPKRWIGMEQENSCCWHLVRGPRLEQK